MLCFFQKTLFNNSYCQWWRMRILQFVNMDPSFMQYMRNGKASLEKLLSTKWLISNLREEDLLDWVARTTIGSWNVCALQKMIKLKHDHLNKIVYKTKFNCKLTKWCRETHYFSTFRDLLWACKFINEKLRHIRAFLIINQVFNEYWNRSWCNRRQCITEVTTV